MTIEILGPGCPNCDALAAHAKLAVDKLGIPCEVFKITNAKEVMARGIIFTPALAIDGEVKSTGQVLSEDEITSILTSVLV